MPRATFSGNSNYYIDGDAALVVQNIAGNYSDIFWRVWLAKSGGGGYWGSANSSNRIAAVVGYPQGSQAQVLDESGFAYDFTDGANVQKFYRQGNARIYHNPDGTGGYFFVASSRLNGLGEAIVSTGVRSLPRIPRGPRVRANGVYRNTIAYVKVNGVWRLAIPYVRTAGAWKLSG